MTMTELKKTDAPYVTADDIAGILDAHPQTIRCIAQSEPHKLGFPVIVLKSRVLIPTKAFLLFMGETV